MDMLLATGEQVSVSLMAITMIQMGVSAVSLNAWQVPMHTTSDYQNARFKRIDTERIRKELDDNKIVIVTGFQGINKYDDITTLRTRRLRYDCGCPRCRAARGCL